MSQLDSSTTPCVFGEVLFDRFPDGSEVLGGAPFNVAWNLQAFGSRPIFISRVGEDQLGEKIRTQMQHWNMDISGLQTDNKHATGTVDIALHNNEPTFDIVANSAYDHIAADAMPDLQASMIYHGSLALRNDNNRSALRSLKQRTQAQVFMDVNLRDPWWKTQDLHEMMSGARWIKLNENELAMLSNEGGSLHEQARHLADKYSLELVIVTLGGEGAFALDPDGNMHQVRPTANIEIVDTVGAGDAFASVCMLGIENKWEIGEMLQRAQQFASAIVGLRGATTDAVEFYQPFVREWDL
jgi:fructokinase